MNIASINVLPTIPTVTTTGVTSANANKVAAAGDDQSDNLRIAVANKLGVSEAEVNGDTSISTATQQLQGILSSYESARTSATEGSIMTDIYAIMNLMQQTAQKLRDAMRQMRQMEMTVVQQQIQSQAQQQRAAAMTQLATGIATFAIQASVTIGSTAMQLKTLSQEASAKATQGVDVAKQQADLAQIADSPAAMEKQVSSLKSSSDPQVVHDVDTQLAEYDANVISQGELDKAYTGLSSAKAELETAKQAATGPAVDTAKAKVEAAKAALAEANKTGDSATEVSASINLKNARAELTKAVSETPAVKAAQAKVDTAQKTIDKISYGIKDNPTTPDDVVAQAKQEYDTALKTANADRSLNDGKVTPEHQQALNKAGQKLVYAQARRLNDLSHTKGGTAKISEINTRLSQDLSTKLQAAGIDSNKTSKVMLYASVMTNVSKMIGDLGQQIGNTLAQYQQAKATSMQADQKQSEEQLDQIRDMFSQTLQTIEKALSLYQSVTQAESQSASEIIGAIRS